MNRTMKLWLTVAASLVFVGGVLFGIVMLLTGGDLMKLSNGDHEMNSYDVGGEFRNIFVQAKDADVLFLPSEDGSCRVVCDEAQRLKYSVSVENGTLSVRPVDARRWYEYISWFSPEKQVTVYLPAVEYGALAVEGSTGDIEISARFMFASVDASVGTGDVRCYASASGEVKIKTATGSACVEGISVGSLALSTSTGSASASDILCAGDVTVGVSTGSAQLKNVQCANAFLSGGTGTIHLQNVIAEQNLRIENGTGDVHLDGCDAAEIFAKASTGDITGTLYSGKIFVTDSSTGRIDVPASAPGGRCELYTTTGDIQIIIQP